MQILVVTVLALFTALACKAKPFPVGDVQVDTGPAKAAPESAGAPPGAAAVSDTSVDVGDVKRGEWAKHTFAIKNTSDQVLHIKNVRGS